MTDIATTTSQWGTRKGNWIASQHGTEANDSYTFDTSTAIKAEHYPDGFLVDGTPLGEVTASPGVYRVWDEGAATGEEVLAGFAYDTPQLENPDGTVKTYVGGALFVHGFVILSALTSGFLDKGIDDTLSVVAASDLPKLIAARNNNG